MEFYGMLGTNSQVCTVLEKSKETMLKFYKRTAKNIKMIESSTVNAKLSDSKVNKLKNTVKNQIGTTLRMYVRMY